MADLLALTRDKKDIDVVLKAIELLCKVYLEIIPSYRLREDASTNVVDDEGGAKKGVKLSKDVKQLREFENTLLSTYKEYLMILERLTKIKPNALIHKANFTDEVKRDRMLMAYNKMRSLSVHCYCDLLEKHPHFNYRLNILQTVLPKIASQETVMRKRVTDTLFKLLRHTDQQLLDFKVDILKELNKVLNTKPHEHMQANLLDCLVLHMIIVDEEKAKAIAESSNRSQQLHDQMNKLRRKGKLKQYKEIKQEMLAEVK